MPASKRKTKKAVKAAKAVQLPKRVSNLKIWDSRQKVLANAGAPRGLVNFSPKQLKKKWGHTGYQLKQLNYLYNVNDSQQHEPKELMDGFQKEPWLSMNRILSARKKALNTTDDPELGEGLCYVLSYYIGRIINKAYRTGGKPAVDEINQFLITCTKQELYDMYDKL